MPSRSRGKPDILEGDHPTTSSKLSSSIRQPPAGSSNEIPWPRFVIQPVDPKRRRVLWANSKPSVCRGHHAWRVHVPRTHDRRPAGQDLRGVMLSGAVPQHDGHGRRGYALAGAGHPSSLARPGQRIVVRRAPSHFGMVSYEILSDVEAGKITATVDLPSRRPPRTVRLRLRHPRAARIRAVEVNGAPWKLPPGRRSDPRTRSVCRRRPLYRRRPGLVAPMHQYRVFPWDDELPP